MTYLPHKYLLIPEAAAIARTGVGTIRHWIQSGKLKSVRPGRRRLILKKDLYALLETDVNPNIRHSEHDR